MTSTPAKNSSTAAIIEPDYSTISSGKKSKNRDTRYQSSLAEENHVSADMHGANIETRTRNLSKQSGPVNWAGKRENYGEELDFSREMELGMDPLQACVLLVKVRFSHEI